MLHFSPNAPFSLLDIDTDASGGENVGTISEDSQHSQEAIPTISDNDCEAADNGNLFENYTFHIHSSVPKDKARECAKKIKQQRGHLSSKAKPDAHTTHVIVDKMYVCVKNIIALAFPSHTFFRDGDRLDELFDWNSRVKNWLGSSFHRYNNFILYQNSFRDFR